MFAAHSFVLPMLLSLHVISLLSHAKFVKAIAYFLYLHLTFFSYFQILIAIDLFDFLFQIKNNSFFLYILYLIVYLPHYIFFLTLLFFGYTPPKGILFFGNAFFQFRFSKFLPKILFYLVLNLSNFVFLAAIL